MTNKALIRQLQISCLGLDRIDPLCLLVDDVIAALRENAMREVQRLGQEIEQEPEYAWPTVADYERDVGFQTNEAFRMAWGMARTTNKMLGHPSQPQRTWVDLTPQDYAEIFRTARSVDYAARLAAAKLKEKNT